MTTLIVILFVNNVEMTTDCIRSVSDTMLSSDEILLIDNGSKPNVSQKMERRFPLIRRSDKNIAEGWNLGIDRFLGGDYDNLGILHNDVIVQRGWMTELKLAFDVYPDCGVSFPRQVPSDSGYKAYDKKIPSGCCFLLKRKTIEKVGKFNPEFHLKPDMEYFKRVRDAGLNLMVCSGSSVNHIGGVTTSAVYSLTFYAEQVSKEFQRMGLNGIDRRKK